MGVVFLKSEKTTGVLIQILCLSVKDIVSNIYLIVKGRRRFPVWKNHSKSYTAALDVLKKRRRHCAKEIKS